MTKASDTQTEKQKNLHQKEKKFSVPTEMFSFFIICLLLTAGLCKFSFYLLKNHRSVVSRESLTQSYTDIRPYGLDDKKDDLTFLTLDIQPVSKKKVLKNETIPTAPEIVFLKEKKENSISLTQTVALTKVEKLAPTATAPIQTAALLKTPPVVIDTNKTEKEINDLIDESAALLDEIDNNLNDEKDFLIAETDVEEKPFPIEEKKVGQSENSSFSVAQAVKKTKQEEKEPLKSASVSPVIEKDVATHWVDMKELRQRIKISKEQKNLVATVGPEKATSNPEGNEKSILATVDAEKTASDFVKKEKIVVANVGPEKMKPATQMPLEKQLASLPEASVSDAPSLNETISLKKEKSDVSIEKNSSLSKEDTTSVVLKEKKTKSSFSSPWKVVKVNGKDFHNPAENLLKEETSSTPEKVTSVSTKEKTILKTDDQKTKETLSALPSDTRAVFYQKGKIKKIFTNNGETIDPEAMKKEAENDWLEKQEAAVWTNMSQSDTPSVWSFTESGKKNKDTAKAFKVADPIPALPPPLLTNNEPSANAKKDISPLAGLPGMTPAPMKKQSSSSEALLMPMIPQEENASEAIENKSEPQASLTKKLFSLFGNEDSNADANKVSSSENNASSVLSFPFNQKGVTTNTAPTTKKKGVSSLLKKLGNSSKKAEEEIALPDEIRLTFRPGNADLSASSVRLLQKYAEHAKKDIQSRIEIRISHDDPDAQNQRLAIIRNILSGEGVSDNQIVILKTNRSPETLVLRTFLIADESYETSTSWLDGKEERLYYKKW